MTLQFTEEERNNIVNNPGTDLLLTEVGMRLVDAAGDVISIKATEKEAEEFFEELRYTCNEKGDRITEVESLRELARRLLKTHSDLHERD